MLTLSQTIPGFSVSAVQFFRNTVGKEEIACCEEIVLFHRVGNFSAIFIKLQIVYCKFFEFGRV